MIDGSMQPFALTLDKFLEHAAKWSPRGEVVTARDGGRVDRIGWADLKDRSQRISAILRQFGVRPGEKVATLAWNTQAHVEVWYAIMGMGAVCHTLNLRLTASQLAWMVGQSGARILIVSADLMPLAREVAAEAPGIERLLVIDGTAEPRGEGPTTSSLEALLAGAQERLPWGGFDETAPCGLCFTSGTTGPPKGVTFTHRSSYLHALRLLQADVMAIAGRDTVLEVVPMFHANAWGLPFAVPAAGGRLVLPGRQLDGASLARLIAAEAVTVAVGVPTVWLGLVEHIETHGGDLPSLERIIVGGAPMPPALMERLERRLGVVVQTSWGMTELSPSGTVAPPADRTVRNPFSRARSIRMEAKVASSSTISTTGSPARMRSRSSPAGCISSRARPSCGPDATTGRVAASGRLVSRPAGASAVLAAATSGLAVSSAAS